ncbi:leucyl aminopeptidase [Williamsia phyllosphaerae]|uniref:Probable cytosol aminopeptidase n=1 Tax=Williamsia phyllosphaerae TaxID=885042 RepID=A0ABQ1UZW8_9NOCA|nr:leucyl aminopeptidase [Williamsia phyllosphaerae]GGF29068.1 putative cytosol aminopeptidase [Williamsia phyllosphaerae]
MSTAPDRQLGPDLTIATSISEAAADVLVIGLVAGSDDAATDASPVPVVGDGLIDDAVVAEISASLAAVGASSGAGDVARVVAPAGLGVASVLAVGLGSASALQTPDSVRRAAGVAARALTGVGTVVTTLSTVDLGAAAEGFYLGAYRFEEFRSDKTRSITAPLGAVALLTGPSVREGEAELDRSRAIASAVAVARDFVNTPPSHLYPEEFAARAEALGKTNGLKVEILDDKALIKQGYGGIVGVGKGSSRLPRLVRLSYSSGTKGAKKVALVGKGVTFDTGGISIKPAAGMENMTSDMGGAAAVIATVVLAAQLGVGVDVTATVPMAENMPSSTAQRPGDVLTQYGGITVEVINTDAEGRLILADAIVRACADSPDYLIDTATLTGAQMVALGTRTPGVMGTDDFRDRVAAVSRRIGENGWAMPFPEELGADLKSRVADLANVTNHRWGGMLSAGIFLREFVTDGVQWAHIDVAGPAFNTGGPWGYTPKGGTGVPVRTMIGVIEDIAALG